MLENPNINLSTFAKNSSFDISPSSKFLMRLNMSLARVSIASVERERRCRDIRGIGGAFPVTDAARPPLIAERGLRVADVAVRETISKVRGDI
jgi:hypothetical protein